MKIASLFVVLTLVLINSGFSQELILPRYPTAAEMELLKSYIPPVYDAAKINPPSDPVRTMAEWEPLQGILITWTSYTNILRQIVDYAQDEGLVYIVCSDSNSVKNSLTANNIPLVNLVFIQTPYNSIWVRDYGPWSVYSQNSDSLYIVDWIYNRPRPNDDLIPGVFANLINVPHYSTTTAPYNLTHTGGNFMVDGLGTAFSSKLILNENPTKTEAEIDTIMKKFMGINRFIKMNNLPYDGIHHIDMHIKLLNEETLLVGEYPPGVSDGPFIEANLQYILNNFLTCYGRPFNVVRIPMPPDGSGLYPNSGGDYRTYTNSIIINKSVIIPTYELRYDTTAFRIYRQAMPGYRIVGINSNSIIPQGGAIHCITKEIGVRNPVLIAHASIRTAADTVSDYLIETKIKTVSGVDSAFVFWSIDTTSGFQKMQLSAVSTDSFIAQIPGQTAGTTVFYYLSVKTGRGNTVTKPLVAPAGTFSFTVENTTGIENKKNSLVNDFKLYQNYPNPFNSETNISYKLAKKSKVETSVYNINGQKINTIFNEFQSAGKYTLKWDGHDSYGNQVSSGAYFINMKTLHSSKTIKILYLK